jgi:arabinofuranosyltransferase
VSASVTAQDRATGTESGTTGPHRSRPRAGRAAQFLVLAAPVVLLGLRAWQRRWMYDDGFINFRIVKMVLSGHGPVFNPGERVEAATSTLWLWLLVVGDIVLPMRLEYIAVLLGIALSLAGLGLAIAASVRLHRLLAPAGGPTRWMVPAGALILASVPPVWDFTTSGFEGGLTFGWIGAAQWFLVRWAERSDRGLGTGAAVVIGLGPLVRPDLGLVTVVCLAAVYLVQWRRDTWRGRVRLGVAALALPVAWQIFRMGYYASLVPNTALAKSAGRSRWEAGWTYLADFADPYVLALPFALVVAAIAVPLARRAWAAGGSRRAFACTVALPLAGLADGLYVVRTGGDYLHARLLLPALWAVLVPVAAAPLPHLGDLRQGTTGRLLAMGRIAALAGIVVWAGVCSMSLRRSLEVNLAGGTVIVDSRRQFTGHPITVEDWQWAAVEAQIRADPADVYAHSTPIRDAVPPDELRTPALLMGGVGIPGYALGEDYTIIDVLGLGDPLVSRLRLDQPATPGHEKPLPLPWQAAVVSDEPVDSDALVPTAFSIVPLYVPADDDEYEDEADAAREALQCPPVRELRAALREPLTPGRFLSNLVHAREYTNLEIPPRPSEALEALCS